MIEAFFFLLLIFGVTVWKLPELRDCMRIAEYRWKNWKAGFCNEEEWNAGRRNRFRGKIPEHIRRMLQIGLSMGTRRSVKVFLFLSVFLAFGIFLTSVWRIGCPAALVGGITAGLLPYLGLRCIIQGRQVAGSHEGEILVTELLNNYKIHYCNMVQAVEVTAMTIEGAPYSRKLLLNLSRGLNRVSGERELKVLTEEFRLAMGTYWSNILADNIYLACNSGMRVTDSLSDLAKSMESVRKIEEFSRRENNEARAILRYLLPLGSIAMTVGGIYFFGLSFREWFAYQFQTSTGIAWFLLWMVSYLTAVGVHLLLTNRKFDL